jgi:hypothetical protein
MLDYILTNIAVSKMDIKKLKHSLVCQEKTNKSLRTLVILLAVWIVLDGTNDHFTNQQIKDLRREIKELKTSKGE